MVGYGMVELKRDEEELTETKLLLRERGYSYELSRLENGLYLFRVFVAVWLETGRAQPM